MATKSSDPQQPLGIMPKWLHDELRLKALCEAIDRYQKAQMPIPKDWIDEMEFLEPMVYEFPYPNLAKYLRRPKTHHIAHLAWVGNDCNRKNLTRQESDESSHQQEL